MSFNTCHLIFCELKSSDYSVLSNGGWGWVVVFASSIISLLGDGFSYSIGEFFKQFLVIYKKSETITSLFTSIMTGVTLCAAPLTSGLTEVYGCRIVSLAGTVLSVSGMLLSVIFDQSIYYHCLTLGLITGTGLSFLYVTQMLVITSWFDKSLPIATGLAACGSGFGMGSFALINSTLIDRFGWKGSMIILAGLMSFCFGMSALYCEPTVQYLNFWSIFSYTKFCKALKKTNNFELLKDLNFIVVVLSSSLLSSVYFTPFVVTPDRIVSSGMGTSYQAGMLLVYLGIFNGIGRIAVGYILTFNSISHLWFYIVLLVSMGISLIVMALVRSVNLMIPIFAIFGLISGGTIISLPVLLVNMFGKVKVANAFGIVLLFNGFATVFGLPLLNLTVNEKGLTKKLEDRYRTPLIISGLVTILAAFLLLCIPLLERLRNYRISCSSNRIELKSSKDIQ